MSVSASRVFLRPKEVHEVYGIPPTTQWRMIRDGRLPEPIYLTSKLKGWDRMVLDQVILGRN